MAGPLASSDVGIPVSLIICTRNRPDLVRDCVHSVLAGDLLPDEIIIADQSDEPHPMLAGFDAPPGCRIRDHHLDSRGLSRARNAALALARSDVIVFTDDDVFVEAGWLRALLRALLEADRKTVITGRVLPAKGEGEGFVPTLKGGELPVSYRRGARVDPLVTFNMATYRDAIPGIGGFDERLGPGTPYPAGEDNEIAYRLLEAGYEIRYTPHAVVHHRAWRSASEYVALRWGYGLGQGAFLGKHARLGDRRMIRRFLGSVVRILIRLPAHAWRRPVPGRTLPRRTLLAGDVALVGGITAGFVTWLLGMNTTETRSDS